MRFKNKIGVCFFMFGVDLLLVGVFGISFFGVGIIIVFFFFVRYIYWFNSVFFRLELVLVLFVKY